jgi:diguanylate cyclase (GGDEF)-like protein
MLDIDWFKRVNDVHGHAIGDRVLRDFATLTGSALENCWKLGRWGGEEFLILMPDCSALQAHAILEGCRRRIESHRWPAPLEGATITFSAGITNSGPGESTDATLQRADLGLYLAKANGRNRTEIFVGAVGHAETASCRPPPREATRGRQVPRSIRRVCRRRPTGRKPPASATATTRAAKHRAMRRASSRGWRASC